MGIEKGQSTGTVQNLAARRWFLESAIGPRRSITRAWRGEGRWIGAVKLIRGILAGFG